MGIKYSGTKNHSINIENVKIGKYLKLNNELLKKISAHPLYSHYKFQSPYTIDLRLSQWSDMAIIAHGFYKKISEEIKQYQKYIKQNKDETLSELKKLDNATMMELRSMFYTYASDEDMFKELSSTDMINKLKKVYQYNS